MNLSEHYAIGPQERQHGAASYNKGCRCEQCREASRERKRRQRAKRKAKA